MPSMKGTTCRDSLSKVRSPPALSYRLPKCSRSPLYETTKRGKVKKLLSTSNLQTFLTKSIENNIGPGILFTADSRSSNVALASAISFVLFSLLIGK